jgi:hypothetical protein
MRPKRGQPKRLIDSRTVRDASAERAGQSIYLLLVECCCRPDDCLDRERELAGVAMKPLFDFIQFHFGETLSNHLPPSVCCRSGFT